jgi:coproporphyrinogen III oxidase-like Fe-S oxidoreductase
VRTPERYLAAITSGGDPEGGFEELDGRARAEEALTLGLRTRTGIKLDADTVDFPPVTALLDSLAQAGLIEAAAEPGRVVLSRRGRLLANDVTARLLVAGEQFARVGTR